jgi:nucleoid DNA-binding protein
MNQGELIQEVADEANLTKKQTQDAVRALLKTIMGSNKYVVKFNYRN